METQGAQRRVIRGSMRHAIVALVAVGLTPAVAGAQTRGKTEQLEQIEIVADSPLAAPDTGMERAKISTSVETLSAGEIADTRAADIATALERRTPGVGTVDVTGNPFQPQLDYRGFVASPVVGTPQGLAVYQNGVRINEAWGDVVNWDLIPTIAIDRTTVLGANPIFGLNALGGAVTLDMKTGFTWQGFEADARFGSRMRRQGYAQWGVRSGDWAAYIAAEGIGDNGWRYFSPSTVRRFYGDIGWRGDRAEIHATIGLAGNRFGASGPAPVDMAALDPRAVYTTPQKTQNRLAQFALNGAFDVTDTWKVKAQVYHRAFDQSHTDGNTTDFASCGGVTLCDEAETATNIPDTLQGGQYGAIDRSWTRSRTFGGGVQATNTDRIGDHGNRLTFGLSYDQGWTNFKANQEIGAILPNLVVAGLGSIVDEPASGIQSVSVNATNRYFGAYVQDTFDVTDRLSVTVGGRYNLAKISLQDQIGTALDGAGTYGRFNPTAGATFKIAPDISVFANYAEANRAPTPLELGCADPNRPCVIDTFLVADPPLKQVVARTIEAGARGTFTLPSFAAGKFDWQAGVYRTINSDDIMSVPSTITGRGYFVNAGHTRRQGFEASLSYKDENLSAYVNYTLTDATFRDSIELGSPDNPLAAALGFASIRVTPGARLSSVARHRIKAGADYRVTPEWKIGGDVVFASGASLRGDEINFLGRLPPYALVNLRTSYQINKQFQIYGLLENALNARAKTFGTVFNTTQIAFAPFVDPRQVSIAPPLGAYVGLKYTY
jgi:iron complex outermembrane recepter protein